MLRDEGEEDPVTPVRYLATFHDFMMLNGLADRPAAQSAIQLASQILGTSLGQ